jgi:hypothetical protein
MKVFNLKLLSLFIILCTTTFSRKRLKKKTKQANRGDTCESTTQCRQGDNLSCDKNVNNEMKCLKKQQIPLGKKCFDINECEDHRNENFANIFDCEGPNSNKNCCVKGEARSYSNIEDAISKCCNGATEISNTDYRCKLENCDDEESDLIFEILNQPLQRRNAIY